ncbi:hypothetical protein FCN45_23405 (plasmid) [Pantoea sp. SO10]|nr:hypothetical protein FCN45_23405 [Pantoea sp. SO10]
MHTHRSERSHCHESGYLYSMKVNTFSMKVETFFMKVNTCYMKVDTFLMKVNTLSGVFLT